MKSGIIAMAIVCLAAAPPASDPIVHKFLLWGQMDEGRKVDFYIGFLNGLVAGAGNPLRSDDNPGRGLLICLLSQKTPVGYDQAMAMIDKYYRDNPEKWNVPIGQAMIEGLMVKNGPCATQGSPAK